MKKSALLVLVSMVALALAPVHAQTMFSDDFDSDHTANWSVSTLGTGSDANFFFDYSTVGIPSAPNSVGGTTLGLRLRANQTGLGGTFPGGVSVSPNGVSFAGNNNYELRFDMWLNFNGPAPAGGSGSTQITGAGIGTAGSSAQIAGGAIDSLNFGTSGEAGSSVDYRAYSPANPTGYPDASPVFAAGAHTGNRNNTDPYYAGFGGATAPAAQVTLFPQQTGATAAGAQGWAWREARIVRYGDTVQWFIDGTLLATVDLTTAGTLGGGNILFNYYDINATVSSDVNSPSLLFGLIDNVRVVPEPATLGLALVGGLMLYGAARRRRQTPDDPDSRPE